LAKPHFFKRWILWWPGNLNLALCKSQSHGLYSATWCGWTWLPGQREPWPLCPGASQRHPAYLSAACQPCTEQHLVDMNDVERVQPNSSMKTIFATTFHHGKVAILAQIWAVSRASGVSCSYASDTMWPQSRNSSTFAFFRPRSKVQILTSGTHRQKQALGCSLFLQYREHQGGAATHGDTRIFGGVPKE
jgi:hypothetical protein